LFLTRQSKELTNGVGSFCVGIIWKEEFKKGRKWVNFEDDLVLISILLTVDYFLPVVNPHHQIAH